MFDLLKLGYDVALSLLEFINDGDVTEAEKLELSKTIPWHSPSGTMIIHEYLDSFDTVGDTLAIDTSLVV